ncbi:hypothetical protein [Maribacter thermophilus]|uniref:hypothetical protein n=1 Tax=Maribacter thermophilus TaxID=1197874 RepID=UPI0006416249|nr:hypothetical protein [Maribacter thermophilus]
MNTYRLVNIIKFPSIHTGQERHNNYNLTLPGFTEEKQTSIRNIATAYHGFEYYEVEHEMLIKDKGLAFGFVDNQPVKMELNGYKKTFTVKMYCNPEEGYAYLCESSNVIKDLLRTLKKDSSLGIELKEIELDLNQLHKHTEQYTGAWFKGVSSRVSSSALFGADLKNEPLFEQLKNDGADLSSITIPFKGMQIQLSKNGGISSHQNLKGVKNQLALIKQIKEEIINHLIK